MLQGIITLPASYDEINDNYGMAEKWELAEALGWYNPIDALMDQIGIDSGEDLPIELFDEAEVGAIDFILAKQQSGTLTIDLGK